MANAAVDLTSVPKVTAYGTLSANVAAALDPIITSMSAAFMSLTLRSDYLNGQFTNEVRIGAGTDTMLLEHFPVIAMAGHFLIAGTTVPPITDATVPYAHGYYIDLKRGLVKLVGYRFVRGANVVIPYFYGYVTVPEDIVQAVNEMVLFTLKRASHIDLKTQTLAQQITTYLDEFPKTTRDIIAYYKRTRRTTGSFSVGTSIAPVLPTGLQQQSFLANGTTNVFTLSSVPAGISAWFRNGMLQLINSDYTQSGAVITVLLPAGSLTGDNFTAIYAV